MATRTLDSLFWDDEHVACVSRNARLLLICMITDPSLSNDYGVLPGNPRTLRKHAFAFDNDVTVEEVEQWRDELVDRCPNIVMFIGDDKAWICLRNFQKFQALRYHRKTTFPSPPDISEHCGKFPQIAANSRSFPMSRVESSRVESSRVESTTARPAAVAAPTAPDIKVIADNEAAKLRMRAAREANSTADTRECSPELRPNFAARSPRPVPVPVPESQIPSPVPENNIAADAAPTAPSPPEIKPSPKPKPPPYSADEVRFVESFGAKRLNPTQRDAVAKLLTDYPAQFWDGVTWTAERGLAMGQAVSALKTALPKWGSSPRKEQSYGANRSGNGNATPKPAVNIPDLDFANAVRAAHGGGPITQAELEARYKQ